MQSNAHIGHRERMRRKLKEFSHRVFDTYELLEMLLYYKSARRDTNPVAKELLSVFGSLDGVLRAGAEELSACEGVGKSTAELIVKAAAACDSLWELAAKDAEDGSALGALAVRELCNDEASRVVMISLDNAGRPIATDTIFRLDFSSGGIKPSAFVEAAIKRGASAVAIAHSHPFGPAFPTEGDIQSAKLVSEALSGVGIEVVASFVVTGRACYEALTGTRVTDADDDSPLASQREAELIHTVGELFGLVLDDGEEQLHALLEEYGSLFYAMLCDFRTQPTVCTPQAQTLLSLLPALASRRITDKYPVKRRYGEKELRELLLGHLLLSGREQVMALAIGDGGTLLSCDLICEGTVSASEILPRLVIDLAKRTSATGVVLAHNHPRGRAVPSEDDSIATARLCRVLEYSGLRLISHYVVAEGKTAPIKF